MDELLNSHILLLLWIYRVRVKLNEQAICPPEDVVGIGTMTKRNVDGSKEFQQGNLNSGWKVV